MMFLPPVNNLELEQPMLQFVIPATKHGAPKELLGRKSYSWKLILLLPPSCSRWHWPFQFQFGRNNLMPVRVDYIRLISEIAKRSKEKYFLQKRNAWTLRSEKLDFFMEMSRAREMDWRVVRISFMANADGDHTTALWESRYCLTARASRISIQCDARSCNAKSCAKLIKKLKGESSPWYVHIYVHIREKPRVNPHQSVTVHELSWYDPGGIMTDFLWTIFHKCD